MTLKPLIATVALLLIAAPGIAQMQHDEHTGPAMNFLRVDDQLATGGHIVGEGLDELKTQGVTLVVDLRDQPPADHGQKVEAAGMQYVNVPVAWRSPKVGDFEKFRDAMNAHPDAHVLVQCQANYRASAFTYLYRVLEAGVPEADARADMNKIWEPEGTWAEFVDDVKASYAE